MDAEDVEDLLADLESDNDEVEKCSPLPPSTTNQPELDISSKLEAIHSIFGKRSPIIDELKLRPEEYIKLVRILGNRATIDKDCQENLKLAIGNDSTIKLCLAFADQKPQELTNSGYQELLQFVDDAENLLESQQQVLESLAETANTRYPNLTSLVDSSTVARLLVKFGSLELLARTPPANLTNPTLSPLAEDSTIQPIPHHYKRQALRILAGKVVLAARLEQQQSSPQLNPNVAQWRINTRHRIDKLLNATPALRERALPRPVEKRTRSRGGRRIRKRKEKQKEALKPEMIKFGGV